MKRRLRVWRDMTVQALQAEPWYVLITLSLALFLLPFAIFDTKFEDEEIRGDDIRS